jgi:class 3 adenylate cyclase
VEVPEARFAFMGVDRIAYQQWGEGAVDLVYIPTIGTCIDAMWDSPSYASFFGRLGNFCRVVMFDRRGFGASDPPSETGLPIWEEWAADVTAVMDAAGSERAAVLGSLESGPTAISFAATRPERTAALVLINTSARGQADADYPSAATDEEAAAMSAALQQIWGTEAMAELFGHADPPEPGYGRWLARSARLTCSARAASEYLSRVVLSDVRQMLPLVSAPTLVVHSEGAPFLTLDQGRYLAERIGGAQLVVLPGSELHVARPEVLDQIEEFLTGTRPTTPSDRALAAVLFTDIVGSTTQAASLGDQRWRTVLESHQTVARAVVEQHRGRLVKMTGDGMLAVFDGPGRGIQCAFGLQAALRALGIQVRAGLHTGEVELLGDDIGGINVHVAARVCEHAGAGEVVVSGVVPVLVAGSGLRFADRGEHDLKGVPGAWHLYAVNA